MDNLISKRSATDRMIIAKTLLESVLQDMPTAEPTHNGFLEFLFNVINPNEMEQYMAMYKSKGVAVNGRAD